MLKHDQGIGVAILIFSLQTGRLSLPDADVALVPTSYRVAASRRLAKASMCSMRLQVATRRQ